MSIENAYARQSLRVKKLQDEIERLRAIVDAQCKWERGGGTVEYYYTDCGNDAPMPGTDSPQEMGWQFCPFCRGRIVLEA